MIATTLQELVTLKTFAPVKKYLGSVIKSIFKFHCRSLTHSNIDSLSTPKTAFCTILIVSILVTWKEL